MNPTRSLAIARLDWISDNRGEEARVILLVLPSGNDREVSSVTVEFIYSLRLQVIDRSSGPSAVSGASGQPGGYQLNS